MKKAPGHEIIKEMRKKKQLSQRALAEKVGLTQQAIALLENGKRKLEFDLFIALLNSMEATPDEISAAIGTFINKKKHIDRDYNQQNIDDLEDFLCYLESIGYELSVMNSSEMSSIGEKPECEDDFLIGISDKTRDNVTFFHKKDFVNFQHEVEKTIDYEIYKQFKKT